MALWVILVILTALFSAAAVTTNKKILFKEHAMEFAAILAIFVVVLSIPLFFLIDYSTLAIQPIIFTFFVAPFGALAFLLTMKTVRHEEISTVTPIMIIQSGLVAILAFILLNETLTLMQISGIILIIVGAYALGTHKHISVWGPLQLLKHKKYAYYLILAIILYSFTTLFDRFILTAYEIEPLAYLAFAQLFIAVDFLILLSIFHHGFSDIKHGARKYGPWILLAAILTIAYRVTYVYSVDMANIALVSSLRKISVLFIIIMGGEFFHEKNIKRKIISSIIMIAGATLIAL